MIRFQSIAAALFTIAICVPMTMAQNSSPGAASSQTGQQSVNPADKKFMKAAAQGGMAEVELGRLAAQQASSEEVKKFGQRMVDDHSKANQQLQQIAAEKGVQLPQKLSPKEQAFHDRLAKLSGKEFDKVYMSHMVKDHVADVADFQRESSRAKDAEVKDFAQQTLPTLQDHLKEARSVSSSVGNASQAMTSSLMKKK